VSIQQHTILQAGDRLKTYTKKLNGSDMAQTEVYKGKRIVFDSNAEPPTLTIDGKPIDVRETSHGRWLTPDLAHEKFASPLDIAKTLIDRME
jgi:hypothetical protein